MVQFQMLSAWLVAAYFKLTDRAGGSNLDLGAGGAGHRLGDAMSSRAESERGDVPGRVMVTVITVTALRR